MYFFLSTLFSCHEENRQRREANSDSRIRFLNDELVQTVQQQMDSIEDSTITFHPQRPGP
jgi:hypothetical protein